MRTFVVANPAAGRGRVGQGFQQILDVLSAEGATTHGPGDASELAARARADGYEMVVAVGGDGTVHEVVNGLLRDGVPGAPVLGVIAGGSGCDFVRTFSLPSNLADGAQHLAGDGPVVPIDLGRVTCDGATHWFANISGIGLGPAVVAKAARLPKRLRGARYFFAFWLTLPRFVRPRAKVDCNGQSYDGPLTTLVVANGKAFGGGMWIAPSADPSDGRFEAQIHWGTKLDYVRGLPKVYKGTHLPHPKIIERQPTTVTVECDPPTLVEADGELLGSTPASYEIVPNAIRLKT